ncbi:hypothetical protein RvY_13635 [Ramazzottius varieornatus]|uniref:Uncharacterized protein n=1 Tax=Ramazzottius varieornatus TaxID=947166 RepID=A0A1D1VTS7_RAMVA|nr:hypothetical protein RvY_13635 [Ramazzottius varieornatus]
MKPSSVFIFLLSGLLHYVSGAPDVLYQVPVRSDQSSFNRGNFFRASLAVRSDAPDDSSDPPDILQTNAITYDNKPTFLSLRRVAHNTSSLIGFGPIRSTTSTSTARPAKVNQFSADIDKSSDDSTKEAPPPQKQDDGPFIPQVAPPSFRPTPGPADYPDISRWTQQTGGNIQQIPDLTAGPLQQTQTPEPVITGDLQNQPQEYNQQLEQQYAPPAQPEAITSDTYGQYQPQQVPQQVAAQGPEGRVAQINFVPAPVTEAPSNQETFNGANFQQQQQTLIGSVPSSLPPHQNIPTQQIPFTNFVQQSQQRFPQQNPQQQRPTFLPQQDGNNFFPQQQQSFRPQFLPQGQIAPQQFNFAPQQQGTIPSQQLIGNGLTNNQGQFVGFGQGEQLDGEPTAGILNNRPAQGPQPGFQPGPGARQGDAFQSTATNLQSQQANQAGQIELQSHQPNLNAADPFAQTENQFLADNNPFQAPNLQNMQPPFQPQPGQQNPTFQPQPGQQIPAFQPQPGQQFSPLGPMQPAASAFQSQPAPTFGPQGQQQANMFQQVALPQDQFNQFLTPEQRQQAAAAQSTSGGQFQDLSQTQFNPFANSQPQMQPIPQQPFDQFGAQPSNFLPGQQSPNVPPGAFPQDARSFPPQFQPPQGGNPTDGMFIPPQPAAVNDQPPTPPPTPSDQAPASANDTPAQAQPRAFDDAPAGPQARQYGGGGYGGQPSYGGGATGPAGYSQGSSYGGGGGYGGGGAGGYGGGARGGYSPFQGGAAGATGFGYPSGGSPYPYGAYGGFGYGYRPYYLGYNYDLAPYGIPTAQDFALYGKNTLHPEKSYYNKGQGYGAQAQGSYSGGSPASHSGAASYPSSGGYGGGYGKADTTYDTPYGKSATGTST